MRKPSLAIPPRKEDAIQQEVRGFLPAFGYEVFCTTVRGAKKGYGTTKGIPDLLVTHPKYAPGCFVGIEMKGPKTPLSPEQEDLWKRGRIFVARCLEDVALSIVQAERAMGIPTNSNLIRLAGASPLLGEVKL